jgi:ABC-type polysaccharide/polyol phosphate export permease
MLAHLTAVWSYRYFWASLVKMDLMTRYRRSFLGIGWSLLHPLAMTAVFCVVFSTLMSPGGDGWVMYAQLTLGAMAIWGFLRDCTMQGCFALLRSEAYIRQVPLPYGIYPLRTILSNLVHFLITLAVIVVLVAAMQQSLHPFLMLWAVLPGVLLAAVFGWALATLAAFATVFFHDVSHIIELGAQAMFFLTPIIYPKKVMIDRGLGWLTQVNPIVPFIDIIRDPIVEGTLPEASVYAYAVALAVGTTGLAVGVIGWLQKKVIFHM